MNSMFRRGRRVLALVIALPILLSVMLATSRRQDQDGAGSTTTTTKTKSKTNEAKELANKVVIVVRHAEKDTSNPANRNPALTAAGRQRAEVLAKLVSKAGVTHLFSTKYRRTRETLAPAAKKTGHEIKDYNPGDPKELADKIRDLPERAVVVVAGHSNTTPALVEALGGEIKGLKSHPRWGPMLGDDEYDRLFLLTLTPSGTGKDKYRTETVELRYGS